MRANALISTFSTKAMKKVMICFTGIEISNPLLSNINVCFEMKGKREASWVYLANNVISHYSYHEAFGCYPRCIVKEKPVRIPAACMSKTSSNWRKQYPVHIFIEEHSFTIMVAFLVLDPESNTCLVGTCSIYLHAKKPE